MKNTVLTILFVGMGLLSMAQTIEYKYDDAGNRTRRHVLSMPLPRVDTTGTDTVVNPSLTEDLVENNAAVLENSTNPNPTNVEALNEETAANDLGQTTPAAVGEKEGLKDQVGTAEITIFPNPTAGKIRVQINGLEADKKSWMRLYDLNGKELVAKEGLSITNKLDLTHYKPGVFFLKIGANGEQTEWKIIRE